MSLPVENARAVGVKVATTQAGAGRVVSATGFIDKDQYLAYGVTSPGGLYKAIIRYRTANEKGFELRVNGLTYSGSFPEAKEFRTHDAGVIELPAGTCEIALGGGWGHYEISELTLIPTTSPRPPRKPSGTLSNVHATPQAKALFKSLVASYGTTTRSGVHEFADIEYVREKADHDVAILSRDLIEYTPSRVEHGSEPGDMVEKVIAEAQGGRVITLCWHWNAPKDLLDTIETLPDGKTEDKRWYLGFYTKATTFDFSAALADEQSESYRLLLRDIDAIAVQLKKLDDANVPVLWRPLHEAEGGWFWWGARGPENYVKLYRLLHDRLTRVHHLDNLIWVYTSGGKKEWYPGDDVVDIIGADAYPQDNRDPLGGIWNTLRTSFGDRKLLTLSEIGGVPDIDRMRRHGVYWSYFATWNDKLGPRGMEDGELRLRLSSPAVQSKVTPGESPSEPVTVPAAR